MAGGADRVLAALHAVAGLLGAPAAEPGALPDRLAEVVAAQVGARRLAFLQLEGEALKLAPPALGLDAGALGAGIRCDPAHPDDLAARIAFGDRGCRGPRPAAGAPGLEAVDWVRATGAADWLAVPWRAGESVLGVVLALDAAGGHGFTEDDEQVLRVAAATAGLVREQSRLAERFAHESRLSSGHRSRADRLAELEELKRRLLNLAAHELRGPVAVLRGYLSMLADGSLDATAQRRIVPILVAKATHMDLLITQMLEGARLDEGRLTLRRRAVDLGVMVRQVIDVAALLAPPGVSVFLDAGLRPIVTDGDPDRLSTIVSNLVDNAIKYSPDGGLVHVTVGTAGARCFVRVRDSGLGIADEDLPVLFTRFGRIVTPENSHIGGTGLGLSLSQELAAMHGGEITVSSRAGAGSEFTLWLPLTGGAPQQ